MLELLFATPFTVKVALPLFFEKAVLEDLCIGDYLIEILDMDGLRLFTMLRRVSCYSRVGMPVSALGLSPANFFSMINVDC